MNYVLLVSHGTVAAAMHETLNVFFLGDRKELLHACIEEGMSPDEYVLQVRQVLSVVGEEDTLTVLADLMGGSPLTYASYVISMMGLSDRTEYLCGMNLPMIMEVLDRTNPKPAFGNNGFLQEIRNTIRPFILPAISECIQEELI
jgi:PTS system N-acetylgalactosamine-specific IIA component